MHAVKTLDSVFVCERAGVIYILIIDSELKRLSQPRASDLFGAISKCFRCAVGEGGAWGASRLRGLFGRGGGVDHRSLVN